MDAGGVNLRPDGDQGGGVDPSRQPMGAQASPGRPAAVGSSQATPREAVLAQTSGGSTASTPAPLTSTLETDSGGAHSRRRHEACAGARSSSTSSDSDSEEKKQMLSVINVHGDGNYKLGDLGIAKRKWFADSSKQ